MQSCSIDILTKIGNFLPLKDRLRFEELSSRFRYLPCQPVQSSEFSLDINTIKETVTFELTEGAGDWRPRILNVISENERHNDDILEALQDESSDGKRTQIYMASSEYAEFSISILHKLMSLFLIQHYCVGRVLASLLQLFIKRNRVHIHLIPEKLTITLAMEGYGISFEPQQKVEFSNEEVDFLECLKGVYEFNLLAPANLKITEKQAERIKQTALLTARSSLYVGPKSSYLDIAIGINEDFLQKLIDRRAETFRTNAASDITPEFLLKYIRNCLAGSYTLHGLDLVLPRTISESDLLSLGFKIAIEDSMHFDWSGRREIDCYKHKKGKWPSDICVQWGSTLRWDLTLLSISIDYKECK